MCHDRRAPQKRPFALALAFGLLVACLAFDSAGAQSPDQSSPRISMLGYLEAIRAGDDARAALYLDLSEVPARERGEAGPRLARRLKVVLDQTLWIDGSSLSDHPDGDREDGRAADTEWVGNLPAEPPAALLLKRGALPQGAAWRVHPATVAQIPRLYAQFGYGWLGEWLPESFFRLSLFELQLWQWLGLLAAVVVAWALATLASLVILRVAGRLARRTETELDDRLLRSVAAPLAAALGIAFFFPISLLLGLAVPVRERLGGLCQALLIAGFTWLLIRVVDVVAAAWQERLQRAGDATAVTVLPMGRRIVKLFLFAIATLSALQNLGFNITGLLAGLGIGGLAVALASQKLFEDFFGGLSLISDQPVRVGDFGRFGPHLGVVEAIGLRSTRVRTLDRTVVSVRNAEFSSLALENFGQRDRIRFHTVLGVRYETSAEQLRYLLIELRRLLVSHERVTAEPARIRFVGFGAHSLDLEIFAYVNTADFDEFLAIREDLLLRIMEIVEACGSGFAFPSQTLYLGPDSGLDTERVRRAEQEVGEQRSAGRLALPDLPSEERDALGGSLAYPPAGSAVARS